VGDDWRLTATARSDGIGHLLQRLREHQVEEDARKRLGGTVAVSADGDNVYAYAGSRTAIHEAERIITELLRERGIETKTAIDRWHELEQRWEDEDVPLPRAEDERRAEHERLEAEESAESLETGRALWEVRLELPSHAETRALAQQLEKEGLPVTTLWTYLLVGAENEDAARALAEQLRNEAPGATVFAEPSIEMVAESQPANPFAIFGGLAS
jgi:hypothetical protein